MVQELTKLWSIVQFSDFSGGGGGRRKKVVFNYFFLEDWILY